jgi:DNA-directed RNA polymerase specialized sigma24 family protein
VSPSSNSSSQATANASAHTATRDQRSDEQLVVAHRAGDSGALRVLIDRYKSELHGFLTRLVGNRTGADDVFQEAFLQVHLSADNFDEERRFKPWLYTIAANKGRDYLRRQKRRSAVSLDAPVGAQSDASLVDLLDGDDARSGVLSKRATKRRSSSSWSMSCLGISAKSCCSRTSKK